MSANTESLNPKVAQIMKVEDEIIKRLEKLNKALLSNELLFVQLAALSKQDLKEKPEVLQPKVKDNASDINTVVLDLGNNSKNNAKFDDSEEEEED